MKLIRGNENDVYRLYEDEGKKIYHRYVGKNKVMSFKAKRWDKPIEMGIGHVPLKNFKIIK